MTADPASWLLADDGPIAEDERGARTSTAGPWRYNPVKMHVPDGEEGVFTGPDGARATCIATTGPGDDPQSMADARHIATWDPARVLAECAAKRQIIQDCVSAIATHNAGTLAFGETGVMSLPAAVINRLAQFYAGRSGWRDEWVATP